MDDCPAEMAIAQSGESLDHSHPGIAPQWYFQQLVQPQQADFQCVIRIVGVVGDAIRCVDDLNFEQRALRRKRGLVHFPGRLAREFSG